MRLVIYTCDILIYILLTKIFTSYAAKESSSPDTLMSKLVEFGFSSSIDTRSFAAEIFAKVPHKQSGLTVSFHLILME